MLSAGLIYYPDFWFLDLDCIFLLPVLKKLWQKLNLKAHSHSYSHDHTHKHTELSLKTLLPLGISGGIVPCVDALAILIVVVSLNKILFGMILLLSFSLGLASVLIAEGILVVIAKNKAAKKFNNISRLEPYLSLSSAIIVTILGILLLYATLK